MHTLSPSIPPSNHLHPSLYPLLIFSLTLSPYSVVCVVLEIYFRTLHMQGKGSPTELLSYVCYFFVDAIYYF